MIQRTRLIAVFLVLALSMTLVACDATTTASFVSKPSLEPENSPPADTASPEPTAPNPTAPAPTESTQPAPAPSADVPSLRIGTTSPEVEQIQQRLIDLGYLDRVVPTQYYDTLTRDAVARFQQSAGLEASGITDASTRQVLFSEGAPAQPVPQPSAPTPEVSASKPLSGIRIGLDPGHQAHGNSDPEPVAPGSNETKAKVSSGTSGVASGVDEYVVNLQTALKLRALLEEQGAEVLMTRETDDVDISNVQRAQMMNDAGVDLVVRLHCNGDTDSGRSGAFILIPSGEYTTAIQDASRQAAEAVLPAFVAATGASSLGLSERSDQTGFNWSTVPVINIEMGHMSNPEEDALLVSDAYQDLCAQGICQGLLDYFG